MATEKFVLKGAKWVINKDPDAVLDYTLDFTDFLAADTDLLSTVETDVTGGLVVDSTVIVENKKVIVWLSGGDLTVDGEYASLTVRITTVNMPARIDDRTLFFNVLEK